MSLLVVVTGSIAAQKVQQILTQLPSDIPIDLLLTQAGRKFYGTTELLPPNVKIASETKSEDSNVIPHIQLCRDARWCVVIPLSADFLAKLALGFADDLPSCTLRAWNYSKPLLLFPAMNTQMWLHPITTTHLQTLQSWGAIVIQPITKLLACGDYGIGALPEVYDCVNLIANVIKSSARP